MSFNPQVVLPLVDQYFKNHRLYFLSTAIHPISSGGHASNKEKEMVTRWASHDTATARSRPTMPVLQNTMRFCAILLKCWKWPLTVISNWIQAYINHWAICSLNSLTSGCVPSYLSCSFLVLLWLSLTPVFYLFVPPPPPLLSLNLFSLFCKLGVLVRHRISLFGKDAHA